MAGWSLSSPPRRFRVILCFPLFPSLSLPSYSILSFSRSRFILYMGGFVFFPFSRAVPQKPRLTRFPGTGLAVTRLGVFFVFWILLADTADPPSYMDGDPLSPQAFGGLPSVHRSYFVTSSHGQGNSTPYVSQGITSGSPNFDIWFVNSNTPYSVIVVVYIYSPLVYTKLLVWAIPVITMRVLRRSDIVRGCVSLS